jgi:periplasmic copper chaperone A
LNRRSIVRALAASLALIATPSAAAHVTLNPDRVAAGSFARFAIRVPNERANADTTKLVVKLPAGLLFVSFQPKAGWTRSVTVQKLDPPVTVEGEKVTERIATVTWQGGEIAPGEFDEFGISAKVPAGAGKTLVFPAVQTYSNGEVVRWIGPESADEPAPRVTLEAAGPTVQPAPAESPSEDEDEGRDNLALGLAIAGLAAGLIALVVALVRGRRA